LVLLHRSNIFIVKFLYNSGERSCPCTTRGHASSLFSAGSLLHGSLLCLEWHFVPFRLTYVWPVASLGYTEHNNLVNYQIFGRSNFEYTTTSVLNFYNFPHCHNFRYYCQMLIIMTCK
jgi:hypothetical protein